MSRFFEATPHALREDNLMEQENFETASVELNCQSQITLVRGHLDRIGLSFKVDATSSNKQAPVAIIVRKEDDNVLRLAVEQVLTSALLCPLCDNREPRKFLFRDVRYHYHEVVGCDTDAVMCPTIIASEDIRSEDVGSWSMISVVCQNNRENGICGYEYPWDRDQVEFR